MFDDPAFVLCCSPTSAAANFDQCETSGLQPGDNACKATALLATSRAHMVVKDRFDGLRCGHPYRTEFSMSEKPPKYCPEAVRRLW